jgi:phosphoribosyl 1,2-cyclic phosphodiesterase
MEAMRIKFYGTRGSTPVCDPGYLEFGGNTTCILIDGPDKENLAILDAGTGIRNLGKDIYTDFDPVPKNILIAFSHFHWDHIQGFPFFKPAYDESFKIHCMAMGLGREIKDLEQVFATQMQKEYFPVQLDQMGGSFGFMLLNRVVDTIHFTNVTCIRHNHPGGAYSYRLERGGKIVTICTDIEHGETIDPRIVEMAKDADLLIHDAQYTTEELEKHRGWGHSSYEQAMQVAEMAGVKQLVMTHHDPDHDDEFLKKMEKKCQDRFPDSVLAREKMEFVL